MSLTLLEQLVQVIVVPRRKVVIHICEIAATTGPIYMTEN
jgi:hypothetical protein